ncbi:CRE-TAG-89 protein [Caenorhabditis remanei]|uniref:CRE-TAG-89 protein n=1 Tax=Caenorhabditis remanei TaxID=31234 RepID=E3NL16_CAERE|nr:CRE-TAG-89 protein [Caenorhabditis remanei]
MRTAFFFFPSISSFSATFSYKTILLKSLFLTWFLFPEDVMLTSTMIPLILDALLDNSTSTVSTTQSPISIEVLDYVKRVKSIYHWLIPMMIIILLIAIIGNGLIVISAKWLSSPVSPYLKLCISLAAADTWAAFLLILGLIVNSYLPVIWGYQKNSMCFEALLEMFRISGMLTSDMHLFALAINQFFGTMYPLKYKIMITTRRTRFIVFCLWTIPLMFVFGWFIAQPDDGLRHPTCSFTFYNRFPFRITIFLIFMLPLISTLIIYGCILVKLLKAKVEFETYCNDQQMEISQNNNYNKNNKTPATRSYSTRSTNVYSKLKLVWTTLLIVSTFSLSWGLCVLYFVMVCADGCIIIYRQNIGLYMSLFLSSTVNLLVMVKLASNPFIYTLRIKAIRSSVDRFLNKVRRRPNDAKSYFMTSQVHTSAIEPTAI